MTNNEKYRYWLTSLNITDFVVISFPFNEVVMRALGLYILTFNGSIDLNLTD